MKNVITPYSLAALQERDHIIYDKVAEKPMILKRGTYQASSYDTARYTIPRSQFMCAKNGKALCSPLNIDGSAMWAQSSFYKITGLTYPATLNVEFYHTGDKTTTTVTGNDAASLATAIKAIHSYVVKTEVLSDGIGVQCNSYNTTDMSNAIYGGMRFRIMGDDAEKVDSQTVTVGGVTLHMMDKSVYQCQDVKSILRGKGLALPPYQAYPWRTVGGAGGPVFHLQKAVAYYSTNGKSTFDKSSHMTRAMFDSLATSSNAEQRAYWQLYDGNYEKYISRSMVAVDDVRGGNGIFHEISHITDLLGSIKTLNYKGESVDAYPCMAKALSYGFDDPIHAPGKWLGADWFFMALLMQRSGLNSSNKTAWDREMLLVGGSPIYAERAVLWLPCCEYYSGIGFVSYSTAGSYACTAKNVSYSCCPFLAY